MSNLDAMTKAQNLPPGITLRADGRLLAQVYSSQDKRRISKTFPRRQLAAAKAWQRDTKVALSHGQIVAGESPSFRRAYQRWLEGVRNGEIRTRSRRIYRPATIARYERAADDYLLDRLGSLPLSEIRAIRLEQLVSELQAEGLAANTIRNTFMPLQAVYRWAVRRGYATVNPTLAVELPLDDGIRDRFATKAEIALLLAALDEEDRPLWATAAYAGIRRGELMALTWADVDLASRVIRVNKSHDPESGTTGLPKSDAGNRRVPIPDVLRDFLIAHKLRAKPVQPLVFARFSLAGRKRGADGPFTDSGIGGRARKRWKDAKLEPITLHECRHTYASLMIAANISPKKLQTYMGHSSITTTYDRYGHLMPDEEEQSADQFQAWLDADHETETATQTATLPDGNGSVEPRDANVC
jgi:integrase